jgi:phosphoserine phosphatase
MVFKHTVLLNILLHHLNKGDLCIISSATISEILEKYVKDLNLNYKNLFLSSSEYFNVKSNLKYYNNFGINKVESLKKMGHLEIDIFFTDDLKADSPLLSMSKSVYLISNLRLSREF